MIDKKTIIEDLDRLIKCGNEKVLPTRRSYSTGTDKVARDIYDSWRSQCLVLIRMFLSDDNDFVSTIHGMTHNQYLNAKAIIDILGSIKDYIDKDLLSINSESDIECDEELRRIFSRFSSVARQLRSRYNNRETLKIEDEYDVQDLLHALLTLYFTDIRPEEWTPSYAGKSARMDFLLKNEKSVIEVKKTREGLEDKQLGDQLIVDIERYKVHPDCKKLICFVFDPEGRIGNPEGVAEDLQKRHEGFVEVIIEPIF